MSVVYEPRPFLHGEYPPIGDEHDHDSADQRFTDSDVAQLSHFTADAAGMLQDDRDIMDERSMLHDPSAGPDGTRIDLSAADFPSPLDAPMSAAELSPALPDSEGLSPGVDSPPSGRTKTITKPTRVVAKQADGRFHCPLDDCKEEVQSFLRRCEWNKHMDKHERPYRCQTEGCENLPGFTYSGGLLRHEREVHKKHGGPKNTVNCPHPNCKRHTGKGFSRQENLNEHLRRVHTSPESTSPLAATAATATNVIDSAAGSPDAAAEETERAGVKRKRRSSEDVMMPGGAATNGASDEVAQLRDEIKRVRMENDKLKADMKQQAQQMEHQIAQQAQQIEQQARHSLDMMAQLHSLEEALRHNLGAPTAAMM
ncbi:C2H2 transcription factor [Cordyceps fumosorosea ARSEF 2679]|uniref:C2H2 transcription factor n=1 Tax=Cordyceps fumosorosea (strain ARSEF 2679) TaxID=1081104 RepID=A0A162IGM5_CORFA|nr:C2H2 transcription factor [Cordyceps fumosorosea ARSEF 2679]OAA56885.1 C2H2 transcription factor [Cordyceps fumosorosea ARSEF 2679]